MMQVATVNRIIGKNRVELSVPRQSACGGNCAGCPGCGATAEPVLVEAVSLIHAQPGQKVIVESSTKQTLAIAMLVYLVPIVLFLAGYLAASVLTSCVAVQYVIGGALFFIGVGLTVLYDRYIRNQCSLTFQITGLF